MNENESAEPVPATDDLLQRGGVLHDVLEVGMTVGITQGLDFAIDTIKDVIHRPHEEPTSPIILPPGVNEE